MQELSSQPDVWLQARDVAATERGRFPAPGDRVAMFGCGTSLYMAQAVAWFREQAGLGETDAFAASEMPHGRDYDVYVAISRSGTTTEVLDVLTQVAGRRVLAITADVESPVGLRATASIGLPFADEESVVQTRFATGAVALWRAHLGHDIDRLAAEARGALEAPLPEGLAVARQLVFLGRGAGAAFASEAALKLREAAGSWTEAYAAMEFRHGPISSVGAHTLVWSLGRLESGLREDVLATGARLTEGDGDSMVELLRVQRSAVELASIRGLDPDRPKHLKRSVVIASSAAQPA